MKSQHKALAKTSSSPAIGRAVTYTANDLKYFEDKVREARAKAETMTDEDARKTMLHIAQMWESMAQRIKRLFKSN